MAVITPQTDLYLLKVPLEMDNTNQLTFANATAQYNYFSGLPKIGFDDFTYQRKDGTIRVPALFDNVINYNYVMYRNDAYSNKWFYAFIEDMEYLNDNVTAIKIRTDVFQCWQFDLNYKRTFVEREHVNNDAIGLHTVPENIEIGEYVINDMRKIPIYSTNTGFAICFVATKLPYSDAPWFTSPYDNIGGVFTGQYMFATHTLGAAKNVIKVYEERGYTTSEAIQNIYMIPEECIEYPGTSGVTTVTWSSSSVSSGVAVYEVKQAGWTSSKLVLEEPRTLDNYLPKNNKMYTYPFSYFYIDNNAGMSIDYRWEDFPNKASDTWATVHPTVEYYKALIPSTSGSGKLFFDNYKKYATSTGSRCFNYGINFGKLPVCAWTTDYYTNWLTQNGVNVAVNAFAGMASSISSIGAGAATGSPSSVASGMVGVGTTIGNTLGQLHQAKTTPPQAHGDINTGDFNFAYDRCAMNFYMMCVRNEFAELCDNYMSMYGYKVNTVKIPNITGRRNWNYIKTIGCYIEADIPQGDLSEIKSMFDRGITLWHNPATFADYSQNNDII